MEDGSNPVRTMEGVDLTTEVNGNKWLMKLTRLEEKTENTENWGIQKIEKQRKWIIHPTSTESWVIGSNVVLLHNKHWILFQVGILYVLQPIYKQHY